MSTWSPTSLRFAGWTKQFWGLELQHVPRGTNQEADDIAKRASRRLPREAGVFEEQLFKPSATPSLSSMVQPREPRSMARPQERACS